MLQITTVRDLGTWFDQQLFFNSHIVNLCGVTRKTLGFVLRQSKHFTCPNVVRLLYNAYVRSKLETNAIIWSPHETLYKQLIERVQKTFVRSLYKQTYGYYPFRYPTNFIIGMVDYTTLEVRRKVALVKYFYNLIRGQNSNPYILAQIPFWVPPIQDRVLRPRTQPFFALPKPRTKAFKSTPLYEGVLMLNVLIAKPLSLDIFADPEPKFLATAGRYLGSLAQPSSII